MAFLWIGKLDLKTGLRYTKYLKVEMQKNLALSFKGRIYYFERAIKINQEPAQR